MFENGIMVWLWVWAGPALLQEPSSGRVAFSNPTGPREVVVNADLGAVTVTVHEHPDVLVTATPVGSRDRRGREGPIKAVPNGTWSLNVNEARNRVTIDLASSRQRVDLKVAVPRETSLEIQSRDEGDILVHDVFGQIQAQNWSGSIVMERVGGSVVAHSASDSVSVNMVDLSPNQPLSLSALYGDVTLCLPENQNLNFILSADRGEVFSDFDLATTEQVRQQARDGNRRSRGFKIQKILNGQLNGGGAVVQMTAGSGNLYIKRHRDP